MSDPIIYNLDASAGAMIPIRTGVQNALVLTDEQLATLTACLADPTIFTTLENFFTDNSNCITGIYMFPRRLPIQGARRNLQLLDKNLVAQFRWEDGAFLLASAYELNSRFYTFQSTLLPPCYIPPRTDDLAYWDFNGYTKIVVFLPFYGNVELQPNDVMGKYIKVTYAHSSVSGDILYFITASDTSSFTTSRLITTVTANIAVEIPLGSTNKGAIQRNLMLAGLSAVAAVVTGGASIALSASGTPFQQYNSTSTATTTERNRNPSTNRLRTQREVSVSAERVSSKDVPISRQVLNTVSHLAQNSISAVNNAYISSQTEVVKTPTLMQYAAHNVRITIYRPRFAPSEYNTYIGKPYGQRGLLGNFSGFVKVSGLHFNNFGHPNEPVPTSSELDIIKSLLFDGVIINTITDVGG